MKEGVFIIAEVGSNHQGQLEIAKEYVRAAKRCGADAVKFQTLEKDRLLARKVRVDGELKDNPQYLNFKNVDLPAEWHIELSREAGLQGIEFMSTPFYLEAVDLLEEVAVQRYKIASGDITFFPLLERVAGTGKPVILSTGASSVSDVERALEVLRGSGGSVITLLHCVSKYPPIWQEMNLRAIATLKERFGLPVGLSDHSPGSVAPITAVALGASVIEKHITFDRTLEGPDHPFAMTLLEFEAMVADIRLVEQALGTGEKLPSPNEKAIQSRIRRRPYDPETLEPMDDPGGLWLRPAG